MSLRTAAKEPEAERLLRQVVGRLSELLPHAAVLERGREVNFLLRPGGATVREGICQVLLRKGQVFIAFNLGLWLGDSPRLVAGGNKAKRQVLLRGLADFDRELEEWILRSEANVRELAELQRQSRRRIILLPKTDYDYLDND